MSDSTKVLVDVSRKFCYSFGWEKIMEDKLTVADIRAAVAELRKVAYRGKFITVDCRIHWRTRRNLEIEIFEEWQRWERIRDFYRALKFRRMYGRPAKS